MQFSYELLMISHKRRLYHQPQLTCFGWTPLPPTWVYFLYGIVVERYPFRVFAADCLLLQHLGFNLMLSSVVFSTFVTFTLKFVSSLRCSHTSFKGFQQFNVFWQAIMSCYSTLTYQRGRLHIIINLIRY
jgi:hypothetical protein